MKKTLLVKMISKIKLSTVLYRIGSTSIETCWKSGLRRRMYWITTDDAATLGPWTSRKKCLDTSIQPHASDKSKQVSKITSTQS